ncbi:MAG TPA: cupin domain-containing protein [Streptosporangiaceae bacterium]
MTVDEETELSAFYSDVDAAGLAPLWTITDDLLTDHPRPRAVPWLWPARTYRPLAARAIRLIPVERGGERRVLSLRNPGLPGLPYAAGTLWGAVQCLGPHESAPAHRHSPGAIRYVISGSGVFTTVNGDACAMDAGDLVLTPSWAWHDHTNTADEDMLWFDGLDLPMVKALDAIFFEPHPELNQPVDGRGLSSAAYAGRTERYADDAVAGALDPAPSPLLVYKWADTDARLRDAAAARPDAPAVTVEYANPNSGASVLPTLACAMLRVFRGRAAPPWRATGNRVYVVRDGHGHSVIDGRRFDWAPGDMFVVPSWSAAEHHAAPDMPAEAADLFVLSDTPVLRALGLYREQALDAPQQVTGVFAPLPDAGSGAAR